MAILNNPQNTKYKFPVYNPPKMINKQFMSWDFKKKKK